MLINLGFRDNQRIKKTLATISRIACSKYFSKKEGADKYQNEKNIMTDEVRSNPEFFQAFPHLRTYLKEDEDGGLKLLKDVKLHGEAHDPPKLSYFDGLLYNI